MQQIHCSAITGRATETDFLLYDAGQLFLNIRDILEIMPTLLQFHSWKLQEITRQNLANKGVGMQPTF